MKMTKQLASRETVADAALAIATLAYAGSSYGEQLEELMEFSTVPSSVAAKVSIICDINAFSEHTLSQTAAKS